MSNADAAYETAREQANNQPEGQYLMNGLYLPAYGDGIRMHVDQQASALTAAIGGSHPSTSDLEAIGVQAPWRFGFQSLRSTRHGLLDHPPTNADNVQMRRSTVHDAPRVTTHLMFVFENLRSTAQDQAGLVSDGP